MFWLSSRYYSPELCRFISPDSVDYLDPESINGLNLYCYCKNNPVLYVDPSGHFAISAAVVAALITIGKAALISAGVSVALAYGSDVISNIKTDGFEWSDAYGNCTVYDSTNNDLAETNPIRYRSYYYDAETGLFYCNSRYYSPELCRWISPDSIDYLDPSSINGLNLYCYCANNPVMYYDPSGYAWETIFDIGFAIWSLVDFIKDPTWANAGWLALDVLALAVPFLPGGSKVITKADDIVDAVEFVNKYGEVIVLGQSMGKRVIPYADEIGATFYKGLDNFKDLENVYGTVGSTFIGYFHNMGYIASNTFKGAKFIDKGFDAIRTLKGLKGMDLFREVMSRVTIYSEKFLAQLLRKKNILRYLRHRIF